MLDSDEDLADRFCRSDLFVFWGPLTQCCRQGETGERKENRERL